MNQYEIVTKKYRNTIEKKLQQSPSEIKGGWKLNQIEDTTWFNYKFIKKEKKVVAQKIATMLSEIIQREVVYTFSQHYLSEREDLTNQEKEQIQKNFIASNCFVKEEGVSYISYYLIYAPILEMLKTSCTIHLDGWMTFRTKQYKEVLEEMLEQVITDYSLQQEYEQFIFLVRENKKLQKTQQEVLHLIPRDNGEMGILNENKEDVTEAYIEKYCEDVNDEDVKQEDLMMNIFITTSPHQIVVHRKQDYQNQLFIETLENIFSTEIIYCEGCKWCKEHKNLLNS